MQQENATSSPPWKIGIVSVTWLRWLPVEIAVVGDVDVARANAPWPKCLIFAFTVSAMPRMNIGRPMPIEMVSPSRGEQPGGEIERLVDDDVVGRAHEVRLHFLRHGDDAVADDLGDDRIGWLRACVLVFVSWLMLSLLGSPALDDKVSVGVDVSAVAGRQHGG